MAVLPHKALDSEIAHSSATAPSALPAMTGSSKSSARLGEGKSRKKKQKKQKGSASTRPQCGPLASHRSLKQMGLCTERERAAQRVLRQFLHVLKGLFVRTERGKGGRWVGGLISGNAKGVGQLLSSQNRIHKSASHAITQSRPQTRAAAIRATCGRWRQQRRGPGGRRAIAPGTVPRYQCPQTRATVASQSGTRFGPGGKKKKRGAISFVEQQENQNHPASP